MKYEYVNRIKKSYVGDDCIQIMKSHPSNSTITILNSDGMIFHYKPNSTLYINEYMLDERRKQFPYSQIPTHTSIVRLKKIEYVNQLFNFNRVYLTIAGNMVIENYVVKDGEEALLATKFILPKENFPKYMNRDEVIDLLNSANGGVFTLDGSHWSTNTDALVTEERILGWYKEELIRKRNREDTLDTIECLDNELTKYFYNSLDKLTIHDVPSNITILSDTILVSVDNNEIESVKGITLKFIGPNEYKLESYDFPIVSYNIQDMRNLEQMGSKYISEPKILSILNKNINKSEINKAKKLVLQRNKR